MNSTFPDEDLVDRVDELGPTPWTGLAHRHTSAGRDPLSGEGARRNGGRWNPPGRPTVYLARPESACVAELVRLAERTGIAPEALVARGWEMHDVQVNAVPVLDLTIEGALDHVGLEQDDIGGDDWSACQAVGEAAHFLGIAGVAAPSATGNGLVLAVFETRVEHGRLAPVETRVLDGTALN